MSLPDIDVDFDPEGRLEVIDYCREKYGHDKVAQCVIYGTIKTKQALKDSARIMGYEFAMGEKVTKALPPAATGGKDVPLHDIFDPKIKTKQALKDSARIMGYEFAMGEKVTKALPPAATGGKDVPLHDIFDPKAKRYAEAREPSATPRRVSSASCTSRTRTPSASPMRRWASRA